MFKIKRDLPATLIGLGIAGVVVGGYYLYKLGKAEAEIETYCVEYDDNKDPVAIDNEGYPDTDLTDSYNELKRRVDVYKTAVKISAVEVVCGLVGVALLDKHLWDNVNLYLKAHDSMINEFQDLVIDKDGMFTNKYPSATNTEYAFYVLGYNDAYKPLLNDFETPMLKDGWFVKSPLAKDEQAVHDRAYEALEPLAELIMKTKNEVKFAEV